MGQYILYAKILEEQQPERVIYLAIPVNVFRDIFAEPIGQLLLRKTDLRLLVFDPRKEVIVEWTS